MKTSTKHATMNATSTATERAEFQRQALALAVGAETATEVRDLLTAIPLEGGAVVSQERRLPRQAFFVLEGRLAISVGDHPVAVLGPGSFFAESNAATSRLEDAPRVHALGDVVLGVAGRRELPQIHRLVPDLWALAFHRTPAFESDAAAQIDSDEFNQHVDDEMGLGLLERIAS